MGEKSQLNLIGKTISKLGKILDQNISFIIYDSLTDSEKKNLTFLSQLLCNSKGNFQYYYCLCNVGVFGNHCDKLGIYFWKKRIWIIFQFIFGCLFLIFMFLSIIKLIITLLNYTSCLSIILSLFTTPKNLANINLIIMSTSKLVYMVYDPYCQYGKVSYKYDRILNELSISSILSLYLLLFIVFVGLNANLARGKGLLGKKCYFFVYYILKVIIFIFLVLIYPTQISLSGYFASSSGFNIQILNSIYTIGILFGIIVYIITFCLICKTRNLLFKYYNIKNLSEKKKDITVKIINNSEDKDLNSIYLNKELSNNDYYYQKKRNIIIGFITQMILDNKIDIINYSIGKDIDEKKKKNYENDDLIYLEEEMKILNQYTKNNSNDNDEINTTTENNINTYILERKNILKKSLNKKEEPNQDFILNEDDMILVHNIFVYSFLYMLVTILYFSYYSTSKNGSVAGNPWSLLFIYSCVHIIELMYMLSIYSVFFIYSTSQEYKNLRFIGELGKYLKQKFNDISKVFVVYKDFAISPISSRFKGMINFKQ